MIETGLSSPVFLDTSCIVDLRDYASMDLWVVRRSLIDLNRAGVPLMELVFEPDLANGDEAAALVKELTLVLTKLNTCLCKMEGELL